MGQDDRPLVLGAVKLQAVPLAGQGRQRMGLHREGHAEVVAAASLNLRNDDAGLRHRHVTVLRRLEAAVARRCELGHRAIGVHHRQFGGIDGQHRGVMAASGMVAVVDQPVLAAAQGAAVAGGGLQQHVGRQRRGVAQCRDRRVGRGLGHRIGQRGQRGLEVGARGAGGQLGLQGVQCGVQCVARRAAIGGLQRGCEQVHASRQRRTRSRQGVAHALHSGVHLGLRQRGGGAGHKTAVVAGRCAGTQAGHHQLTRGCDVGPGRAAAAGGQRVQHRAVHRGDLQHAGQLAGCHRDRESAVRLAGAIAGGAAAALGIHPHAADGRARGGGAGQRQRRWDGGCYRAAVVRAATAAGRQGQGHGNQTEQPVQGEG